MVGIYINTSCNLKITFERRMRDSFDKFQICLAYVTGKIFINFLYKPRDMNMIGKYEYFA